MKIKNLQVNKWSGAVSYFGFQNNAFTVNSPYMFSYFYMEHYNSHYYYS